jgi:lactate dehydrogenase-like 2-hydroxyacid dehydrogenase
LTPGERETYHTQFRGQTALAAAGESMEKTKVAIVGMGTVGAGVARLLIDHGDRTARHAGRTASSSRTSRSRAATSCQPA